MLGWVGDLATKLRTYKQVCGGRSTAHMVKIHSLYVVVQTSFRVQLEFKLNNKHLLTTIEYNGIRNNKNSHKNEISNKNNINRSNNNNNNNLYNNNNNNKLCINNNIDNSNHNINNNNHNINNNNQNSSLKERQINFPFPIITATNKLRLKLRQAQVKLKLKFI